MKRLVLLFVVALSCYTVTLGQDSYEMVVERENGYGIAFNVNSIYSIYFSDHIYKDSIYYHMVVEASGGQKEEFSSFVKTIFRKNNATGCPDSNHPHMIDLGLPSGTKWACCNVGASNPEDYGGYYAWGETNTKEVYDWSTYKWCNGSKETLTKYNTDSDYGTVDNKTTLKLSDDAATVNWGKSWKTPTTEQCVELVNNCTVAWATQNRVKGMKVIGSNGNTIFLPAAGARYDRLYQEGSQGHYLSSTISEYFPYDFCQLFFTDYSVYSAFTIGRYRCYGNSVRPVYMDSSMDEETEDVSALIEITGISFCNTDINGNVIDDYGEKLYENKVKYIKPKLKYNGLATNEKDVTLYYRIVKEDGSLLTNSSSPEGYTNKYDFTIKFGNNQMGTIVGWGSETGETYSSGQYTFEIWLDDIKFYETYFVVHKSETPEIPDGYSNMCPDSNHPHMIDLGLPSGTQWACCNVGANKPEDYGGYYAWGEKKTKSTYEWSTYTHCDGSIETCHNLGLNIAGTSSDAATANWGTPWKMPTRDQCKELVEKTTSVWTTQNGVNGRKFTGPNGGTIFLPAAGFAWGDEFYFVGSWGEYWSSMPHDESRAYALDFFDSGDVSGDDWVVRRMGHSVRPVR